MKLGLCFLHRGEEKKQTGVALPKVLRLLAINRLIDPGSEFRVHRHGFDRSARGELLGEDFAIAEKNRLYRCLDRILEHKQELFAQGGELYVLAKSEGRRAKERAMRRKKLAWLLWKLHAMRLHLPSRDQLLLRIGAARKDAGRRSSSPSRSLPKGLR